MKKNTIYQKVNRAVKNGTISQKENCEFCGEKKDNLIKHHFNYDYPLDITWLCRKCHGEVHKNIIIINDKTKKKIENKDDIIKKIIVENIKLRKLLLSLKELQKKQNKILEQIKERSEENN